MNKQNMHRLQATQWDFLEVAITREIAAWMPCIGNAANDEQLEILLENILWEYKQLISGAQTMQANIMDLRSRTYGPDEMDRNEYYETLAAYHDNTR